MKEGEKHHLERKVAQMEAILILCVSKEVVHKNHARRAWCAHGKASWGKNQKNGCREKNSIGPKWNMMWSISCALMLSAKTRNPYKKRSMRCI